jgi:hypothetical protein
MSRVSNKRYAQAAAVALFVAITVAYIWPFQ